MKRYPNDPGIDIPPIKHQPKFKVFLANRAGKSAGYVIVEAPDEDSAREQVIKGESETPLGLGWQVVRVEPAS